MVRRLEGYADQAEYGSSKRQRRPRQRGEGEKETTGARGEMHDLRVGKTDHVKTTGKNTKYFFYTFASLLTCLLFALLKSAYLESLMLKLAHPSTARLSNHPCISQGVSFASLTLVTPPPATALPLMTTPPPTHHLRTNLFFVSIMLHRLNSSSLFSSLS